MEYRRILSASLVVAVAGFAAAVGGASQPMIGKTAPPFALESIDGTNMVLSELRGKLVVIHFAASW